MKLQHRGAVAAAALSAAALLGGGVAYAATQLASPAAGRSAASSSASVSGAAMMDGHGMRGQDMSMGMGSFTDDQPFDAQFIDQMSVHHQGAIMSTQAMIADSDRPELRALAEDILTSQREQITQMRDWRAQWYPDLEPTFGMTGSMMSGSTMGESMMSGSMMGGAGDGDSMMNRSMMGAMMGGSAGIERMYLRMMIAHHQLGVDMAEQAQRDAVHPELEDLAAVIAEEQAAQITQMRGYLAASPEPAGG
jgi:uncharacterized protein (DUF305 family)